MTNRRHVCLFFLIGLTLPYGVKAQEDTSTSAVISTIVLALILAGVFLSCFIFLRPRFPALYQPKTYRALPPSRNTQPLPKDAFKWIGQFLRAPDAEIMRINGFDAYSFIWFLVLMLRIFVPIWILSWIVLMPLYAADLPIKGEQSGQGRGTGFNMFIFGNIVNENEQQQKRSAGVPVSYTHLTLPTICSV